MAAVSTCPVTVMIGDLALLHDMGALALVQYVSVPVVMVVLNNDGGALFDRLPIVDEQDVFEDYFRTPHGRQFESISAMFDWQYRRVTSVDAFSSCYASAIAYRGGTLIEVQVV